MAETFHRHVFENGLTLLAEPMPWLRSAAFAWALPAGCQWEPDDRPGLAGMVCEMVQRGAGGHSSRGIIETQDNLGLERSSHVTTAHTVFSAAMPSESLAPALALYADIVRRPHLPADQLEDARQVSLQELWACQDDLPHVLLNQLREQHYGPRVGRAPVGTESGLEATQATDVRAFFETHYRPAASILAVAGRFDWPELKDRVARLLADWPPAAVHSTPEPSGTAGYRHLHHPSQQTHIGVAFPSVPYGAPGFFEIRGIVGVLSDGMSSRLFTRVREQRGLCYSISATCHSVRGAGGVFVYAGTTAARAQETLDVTLAEFDRVNEGIDEDELQRLKVRIQSGLIMEQESSAARAAAIVSDWYHLGRVMPRAELQAEIDRLTPESLTTYWRQNPPTDHRITTLGPEPLRVAAGTGNTEQGTRKSG